MVASEANQEEPENLWEKILKEASRSVADRLESKHVLIVGDRNSGKSTLLARLQGLDIGELQRGIALDYSFIDIHSSPEADDDPVSRINVWQLEGEPEHKDLLRFAINANTITNCMAIIALDFSQPWNIIESLQKWLELLKKHINSITDTLALEEVEEMKRYLIYDFQQFTDTAQGHSGAQMKQHKKRKPVDEQSLLPLTEGVLTNNLGIPLVIVCCKSDNTEMLEKEYAYKEAHFDFIQQYLRRICLSYGAALIYTSAKKERNCDVLLHYMRHKLYGFDFTHKLQLVEKDTIFMPAGADSMKKIQVDFENQNLTKDPDEPYEEVIKIPKRLVVKGSTVAPLVVAEDDQEFLANYKDAIEKDLDVKEKPKPDILTGIKPNVEAVSTSTPPKPSIASLGLDSPSKPISQPNPLTPPGVGVGPDREHQVLADFFNSLIHKDRAPVAVTGGRKPAAELAKGLNIPARGTGSSSPNFNNREDVAKQLDRIRNKYQKET